MAPRLTESAAAVPPLLRGGAWVVLGAGKPGPMDFEATKRKPEMNEPERMSIECEGEYDKIAEVRAHGLVKIRDAGRVRGLGKKPTCYLKRYLMLLGGLSSEQ
jgi:hypothetical protein